MLWADRARLQQIIWNLLSNAVKFTPRGGTVTLRLEANDACVQLVVEDTGIASARSSLPHLFERFRQGDADTGPGRGGLGLGLGPCGISSSCTAGRSPPRACPARARGSRFTVILPSGHAQAERTPAAEPEAAGRAWPGVVATRPHHAHGTHLAPCASCIRRRAGPSFCTVTAMAAVTHADRRKQFADRDAGTR